MRVPLQGAYQCGVQLLDRGYRIMLKAVTDAEYCSRPDLLLCWSCATCCLHMKPRSLGCMYWCCFIYCGALLYLVAYIA
jgi:hypothetical protein